MSSAKKESKHSFEQSLKRLERIVEQLEEGEITLDEALKMYEEGIELSKSCIEKLTQAELRLKKLSKDINGNFSIIDQSDLPEQEK